MDPTDSVAAFAQISAPFLNLWSVCLLLIVTLPGAAYVGFLNGVRQRRKIRAKGRQIDTQAGETTNQAVIGLLTLLLAFSFGNALALMQTDKRALIEEAAALGTAFARADFLEEPGRTALKQALFDYAKSRIIQDAPGTSSVEDVRAFLKASLQAQQKLWPLTVAHTADPTPPAIRTFVAGGVNAVLDAHLNRMQTLSVPVSQITQLMMYAAALVGLFLVGDRSGLLGRRLTWRTFLFSGFLVLVMLTITDTQRRDEGLIRIDQGTLRATVADMQAELGT